jgi:predicted metal-dependent enzyme (double-stranded beta helix superfamily)
MRNIAVVLIATALAGRAQSPAAVAVDQEPHHQVVFKNDFIRVIDATFPPGYVTLNHSHDIDNVAVTIATGQEPDTAGRVGRAGFSKGGYSHRVTNSGPAIMRFIDVEIFKSDRPPSAAAQLANHTLELENDRVRVYRVKLGPEQSLPSHTHAAGWIEVTVTGGRGPGFHVWRGAGESSPLKVSAGDRPLEIVEIEPK